MKKYNILVVDDDKRILNLLTSTFKSKGYAVYVANNGMMALQLARTEDIDMIVLDLLMPEKDGLEVLRELREFSQVPVIILSARGNDIDKITGIKLGADDYLSKPFNPEELIVRVEAIKRRLTPRENCKQIEPLSAGNLFVDFDKLYAQVKGNEVHLTKIEWRVLSELARYPGRPITYEELLTKVWGIEYRNDVQLLRACISRLRRKLAFSAGQRALISNIARVGYQLRM